MCLNVCLSLLISLAKPLAPLYGLHVGRSLPVPVLKHVLLPPLTPFPPMYSASKAVTVLLEMVVSD